MLRVLRSTTDLIAGTNAPKIGEFKILREVSKMNSSITNTDFRKADFSLFRDMLGRTSLKTPLKSKEVQESWLIFRKGSSKHKNHPFRCAESQATMAEGQY